MTKIARNYRCIDLRPDGMLPMQSFQKHYTHELCVSNLVGLQLEFSGPFECNLILSQLQFLLFSCKTVTGNHSTQGI